MRPTISQAELRRRILAVVTARQRVSEVDIWRADAPNFLPWNAMVQEIIVLDREKKLQRTVIAPGNILIHTIAAPLVKKTKANATKKTPSRKTNQRPVPTKKSR